MALPEIVTRDEWLTARKALLDREKDLTRQRDLLNADRRRLPMVEIDKPYRLEGPDGSVGLLDLFDGRRQLVVQHFMFDPDWDSGCSACTAAVDENSPGLIRHLGARQTTFAVVSRAPLAKLEAYKRARGWSIPWYSSFGSDFNYDFHVTIDASVCPVEFNYRNESELRAVGLEWMTDTAEQPTEQPGISCFLRDGDRVFHTYSTFARGSEQLGGAYAILDLTALGRQEQWEEPNDRVPDARQPVPDFS